MCAIVVVVALLAIALVIGLIGGGIGVVAVGSYAAIVILKYIAIGIGILIGIILLIKIIKALMK